MDHKVHALLSTTWQILAVIGGLTALVLSERLVAMIPIFENEDPLTRFGIILFAICIAICIVGLYRWNYERIRTKGKYLNPYREPKPKPKPYGKSDCYMQKD